MNLFDLHKFLAIGGENSYIVNLENSKSDLYLNICLEMAWNDHKHAEDN